MYKRSELREKAMVILYQMDINNERKINYDIDDVIKANLDIDNDFVKELVYGVEKNKEELNSLADEHMDNWSIDRIDKTGKAILQIALYELKHTDTPDIVVINEAVELAKKYSDERVKNIINAVLDKIIKKG